MSNPNYAPNPKKQQVYRNLQNKKLSDVTAKDIQQLTDPTFIQATNQDALITYNMLNKAAMRDGLPIPNTMKIVSTGVVTSSTTTIVFRPNPSEVWLCQGIQMDASGGAGAVTAVLMYFDGTNEVRIESNSTAGTAEFNITSTAGPLYVSNDVYLQVVTSSVGVGEQAIFNGAFVRVR